MIRTPETFLRAIKNLIESNEIQKNKIQINFSYTENEEFWKEYLKNNNLDDIVKFKNYMNHEDSIKLSINSDLLLLIVGPGDQNKSVYTGKVFEYLRMGKPILALYPKESIVEKLLEETNSGENFEFDDIVGMQNYILKLYKEWENKHIRKIILNNNIEKYERKQLTKKLSQILDEQFKISYSQILCEVENQIAEKNFIDAEKLIKKLLQNNPNDFKLLSKLVDIYLKMDKYYEAYKFCDMSIEKCGDKHIVEKLKKTSDLILINHSNNIPELKRNKKYNFIICGQDINCDEINILESIGNIEGIIKKYSSNINTKMIDLESLNYIEYDYIIILEKNKQRVKEMLMEFKNYNVKEKQIFDFYAYSYPYFIDGFKVKINSIFKQQKIEMLIMGLSYAEIGIDCSKLPISSFNFALSGQDIFYDYHLTKYLLKFDFVRKHLKYVLINMPYYAFDYDLSLGTV